MTLTLMRKTITFSGFKLVRFSLPLSLLLGFVSSDKRVNSAVSRDGFHPGSAMKASLCLAALLVVGLCALPSLSARPRGKEPPKLRVVIDASRDGGAWWFPQGPAPFDSEKWHQGSELAAYFKGRGWEVIEIPRGARLTNQLESASIVVRMNQFGTYLQTEVDAYREFVRKGGSLLLVRGYVRQNEAENDSVAKQFGLRFEGVIEAAVMHSAAAYRKDFDDTVYRIGSIVVRYPKSTRPLAYLDHDRLVMGMFRFGRGKIVFLSSVFSILHVRQQFTTRLFDELAKAPPRPKRR